MGCITLGDDGSTSILARSVVVHEGTDDLGLGGFDDSLKTGHAGARCVFPCPLFRPLPD